VRKAAVLIGAVLILTGCATTKSPSAVAGCEADKAAAFVGRRADAAVAEQARLAAGAEQVRVLAPDTIVTMEFLAGRLNLSVDAAGVVQSVRCG
jgi:23S rRNA G2445 N2-methylase RlmL